jgi:hypothetical protein
MRWVLLFEASGAVRDALTALGHDAMSVDLRDSATPGQHHKGDVWDFINGSDFRAADAVGAFPTCTFVAGSGIHWNYRIPGRAEKTKAALDDFRRLREALRGKRFFVENPRGVVGKRTGWQATQEIQPYQFGDDASKATTLRLDGFMPLVVPPECDWNPGRLVEWPKGSGKIVRRWPNQTDGGQNKLGPSDDRWAERSNTYPGIAAALALQFGGDVRAKVAA